MFASAGAAQTRVRFPNRIWQWDVFPVVRFEGVALIR
jgi:hypothetical protein